ncbi:hypothetical protein SteCoe_10025 [Stentor coeruleus]|uniref:Centromere protein J C-terminal domain-containing protein n=1 Tax=Stentor coeruleus TaxID=5963 RepID=A0A1R2CGJ8_9CILI|nr:hypothetical protein SteCoe_10025 [Stentor coeruleus]
MARPYSANFYSDDYVDEKSDHCSDNEDNTYNPSMYTEQFENEDEAWGELDHQVDYKNSLPQIVKKAEEKTKVSIMTAQKPSKINQKYFGIAQGRPTETKVKEPSPEEKVAEIAKVKIQELNQSLAKAKKEAEKNSKLKGNKEDRLKTFSRAKEEMDKFENEIMAEIDKFAETEQEKLKKVITVYDKNQKELSLIPVKKERNEIEQLKSMLAKMKEDAQIKHNKFKIEKERKTKLIEDALIKKKDLLKRIETLDSISGCKNVIPDSIKTVKNPQAFYNPIQNDLPIQKTHMISDMPLPAQTKVNQPSLQSNMGLDIYLKSSESATKPQDGNPKLIEPKTKADELISKPTENINKPSANPIKTINSLVKPTQITQASPRPEIMTRSESPNKFSGQMNTKVLDKIKTPNKTQVFEEPEAYISPEYTEKIPLLDQKTFNDGRIVKIYDSGHKEILYPNGTKKEEYPNGYSVFFYVNQDIKQNFPDGKILYFYAQAGTMHSVFPDGMEIIRFGNGQVEKRYSDGSKKIKYADGTAKIVNSNGEGCTTYPDSTKEIINALGERAIIHPGGHKEIHTSAGKKRIYHNGTSKNLTK